MIFGCIFLFLTATQAQDLKSNATSPYTISGNVLNIENSSPISGAIVLVKSTNDQKLIAASQTSEDGRFSIQNLSSGDFSVSVRKTGYIYRHKGGYNSTQAITLDKSIPSAEINFTLVALGAISGRVADTNNNPLIGATVQLVREMYANGMFITTTENQVVTNDLGEFRLFGLRPGRYFLRGYFRDDARVLGLHQQNNNNCEDFAVTYFPKALSQEESQVLVIRPGQVIDSIHLQLITTQCTSIFGTISGQIPADNPIQVFLQPHEKEGLGPRQVTVIQNDSKTFSFKNIPNGDYVVTAEAVSEGKRFIASAFVPLNGSAQQTISLQFQSPFTLKGTLRIDSGTTVPSGSRIILQSSDPLLRIEVRIGENGHFLIPELQPGLYNIRFGGSIKSVVAKSIIINSSRETVSPIELTSDIQNITVIAANLVGQLSGTIEHSDGTPASSGVVLLTRIPIDKGSIYATTVTADGKFIIDTISPGTYRVSSFSDLNSIEDIEWSTVKYVNNHGKQVNFSEAEKKTLNLKSNSWIEVGNK